jgi:FtsH-binding integral membrane protein
VSLPIGFASRAENRKAPPRYTALQMGYSCLQNFMISLMTDYSAAIYGLIAFTAVITAGVVYVLAQPTDLPSVKARG